MNLAPPDALAAKISLHTPLTDPERAALGGFVRRTQTVLPGVTLAAAGEPLDIATIVVDGMLARTKMLRDGRRQILSLLLPGDLVDAHASVLKTRDDNLEALSRSEVAIVPQSRVAEVGAQHPRLHEAFLREAFIEAAIVREWVLNVGQRNAMEALAHLFCELHYRMNAVGRVAKGAFAFPLRQQDLADALGVSAVHLNRVFLQLRETGLVTAGGKTLTIVDLSGLRQAAHFDSDYLHLDRANTALSA